MTLFLNKEQLITPDIDYYSTLTITKFRKILSKLLKLEISHFSGKDKGRYGPLSNSMNTFSTNHFEQVSKCWTKRRNYPELKRWQ